MKTCETERCTYSMEKNRETNSKRKIFRQENCQEQAERKMEETESCSILGEGNPKYTRRKRSVDMTDDRAGGSEVGGFNETEESGHRPVCVLEDGGVPPFPNEPTGMSEEGSPYVRLATPPENCFLYRRERNKREVEREGEIMPNGRGDLASEEEVKIRFSGHEA